MKILDVLNQPWAITQDKLDAMHAVYERHEAGVSFDAEAIKAAIGDNQRQTTSDSGYTIQNGVGIIPVDGILAKKMNLFMAISGGMSTEMLVEAVNQAIADPNVHSILLDIDSPGGEVDGTQQIGAAVAASTKPTAAFIDGQGCSAAYWIASQCDAIYAASDTSMIGSISVLLKHTDRSGANTASGKAVTYISSGKYKAIANSDTPLSQDGRSYLQGQVDYLSTLFVNTVADGRGVSPEIVWADMGEGRVFFSQQAVDAGLIDGIMSKDQLISQLNADFQQHQQNPGANRPANRTPGAKNMFKTFATEADYNAALAAEFERGKATATANDAATLQALETRVRNEGSVAGATAERERIKAVEAQALPGHTALIASLKFDGKTTGPEAAVQVLAAERTIRGNKVADLATDAGTGVAASAADAAKEAAALAAAGAKVEVDPKAMAAKITAHIAAAEKEGRKLSVSQAAAEIEAAAK